MRVPTSHLQENSHLNLTKIIKHKEIIDGI
jgi:hypothetical protein